MTKKKDPSELKTRGRKAEEYDNSNMRSHLAGVVNLNQLTPEAENAIKDVIMKFHEGTKKRKTYTAKNILFLVSVVGNVTSTRIKEVIDESPKFELNDYGTSSVRDYKRICTDAGKALQAIQDAGRPVRRDWKPDQEDQYLTGQQMYELKHAIDKGKTKEEIFALISKFM